LHIPYNGHEVLFTHCYCYIVRFLSNLLLSHASAHECDHFHNGMIMLVSHSQTIISCLEEKMMILHRRSDIDHTPQTIVQIFRYFVPLCKMPNACWLTATSNLAWHSCPLFHTAMILPNSSNGTTYNQQHFTAQWNVSAPYAAQFSPALSHNTIPVHTALPPTFSAAHTHSPIQK
jgi:hypothetical protein